MSSHRRTVLLVSRPLLLLPALALLAGCGGAAVKVAAPPPSHSASPSLSSVPVLRFSGFDRQSFLLGCDEVAVASAEVAGRDPESSVARSLTDVASGWGKLPDPTVQSYAAAVRAAVADPFGRSQAVASAVRLCAVNGYKPSP